MGGLIFAVMLQAQLVRPQQLCESPALIPLPQDNLAATLPWQEASALPAVVTGLNGYHAAVPVAWKPDAADTLSGYDIYRSTSTLGPFHRIANSIKNCYYRDHSAGAGILYHYKIKSIYAKSESEYSGSASGRARDSGYIIQSAYAGSAPVADGVIRTTEWSKAAMVDILYPGLAGTVRLYVQNDQNRLYLAVDDHNNTQLESWDSIGLFFDRDMDREWCSDAAAEGLIQVYWEGGSARNRFLAVHGKWPDKLSLENAVVLPGITQGISAASGHVQTEIIINLKMAPFNYLPFAAMGFLIYTFDGGSGQFSGAWPQESVARLPALVAGYNWAYGPFSYGDLCLSSSAPSDFWADVDRDHDVDIMDIQLVASRWGADRHAANYVASCDVNADGYIDIFDIQLVASWWNKPLPSARLAKEFANGSASVRLQVVQVAPEKYELWVDNAVDLAAFQLEFTANGAGLQKMEPGDFLGRTGNRVVALPPALDAERGTITLGAFTYGEFAGAGGSGKLAAIIFDEPAMLTVQEARAAAKSGEEVTVEVEQDTPTHDAPEFELLANYPNPFNSTTVISFSLSETADVIMTIHNARGQSVEKRELGKRDFGVHQVVWDGARFASGVYFCRIATPVRVKRIKLLMMR